MYLCHPNLSTKQQTASRNICTKYSNMIKDIISTNRDTLLAGKDIIVNSHVSKRMKMYIYKWSVWSQESTTTRLESLRYVLLSNVILITTLVIFRVNFWSISNSVVDIFLRMQLNMYLVTRASPTGTDIFRCPLNAYCCQSAITQQARDAFDTLTSLTNAKWAVYFYKELFRFYILLPLIVVSTIWLMKTKSRSSNNNTMMKDLATSSKDGSDFVVVENNRAHSDKDVTPLNTKSSADATREATKGDKQVTSSRPSTSRSKDTDFVLVNNKSPLCVGQMLTSSLEKIKSFHPKKLQQRQIIAAATTCALLLFLHMSQPAAPMHTVDPIALLKVHPLAEYYVIRDAWQDLVTSTVYSNIPGNDAEAKIGSIERAYGIITDPGSYEAFETNKLSLHFIQKTSASRPMSSLCLAAVLLPFAVMFWSSTWRAVVPLVRGKLDHQSMNEKSPQRPVKVKTILANVALALVVTATILWLLQPVVVNQQVATGFDPYKVLGIHEDSDIKTAKRSYRFLMSQMYGYD